MYNPAHFTSTDLSWLDWLAASHAFGTLVSQVDEAPFATHLPVLYRRSDSQVVLSGHWARPNPQWRDIERQRVLFMFQGPHAYISPRWYADAPKQVPTWNYIAAHVYGTIRAIHEGPELERIVIALAAQYEAGIPVPSANGAPAAPWRLEDADPANRARLKGIVGFELRADSVQLKLKLNQNHPAANVLGAIAGLRETGSPEAAAVADLMEKELARR
ncbi:MAG TPA: FMN-binding negative transcriptional regulator [Steroidobacteraceae bacterium]|nr:FMN-binding negative transcriptional regulator [Steroidobacteraceae bacterium]